jgi:probable F420-dependent oxidoreductase
MKLGVFLQAQWDPGTDIEDGIASLVRQAQLADELGYDSAWLPQHYVSAPYASVQPGPLMGLLAGLTRRIRLGTGVFLLPFTRPVVLAEEMASLDWITGGRLIFGAGMGYRTEEFDAIGVPIKERVGRFTEGIEVIRRLWTEDGVTHHGKYFTLDDVTISLKPKQSGGPPVWIGGSVPAAIRRAARIGDVWVSSMNPSFEELGELYSEFDSAREGQAAAPERPVMRECYIGETHDAALAEARDPLYGKYSAYQAWGSPSTKVKFDGRAEFEALLERKFLVGDVKSVGERLRWLRDELGIDHVITRVRWPGLTEEQALNTMRRLADIAAGL